ncbi:DUF6920 family protein [Hoeflea olei]|uniref:Uncharacterized protein n=1 Tax=Hoeflea olei TaxID=1480615 RepID=A0A1C1Z0L0_9HYPH|nr:DUF6544 family protein [Hoeflea olei]OCW59282.1 hypothetical protein AWJ14_09550 [Hoeflea olei]
MLRLRHLTLGLALGAAALAGTGFYFVQGTRGEIDRLEERVVRLARPAAQPDAAAMARLPAPVARYFAFAFPDGVPEGVRHVAMEMEGDFRRPLTEAFNPTTARQLANLGAPDMVFSAVTPIIGPLWAVAWDSYIDGEMEMNARLVSAVTVMHEDGNPVLDVISLRRWLLESPLYPMALLPGGPVRWEAIDDASAMAIVSAHGNEARLIARFDASGALASFEAPEPGDLATPYHGSGEHVARSDYRPVDGVMVPMGFEISRVGPDGLVRPFWRGKVTHLSFEG